MHFIMGASNKMNKDENKDVFNLSGLQILKRPLLFGKGVALEKS